MSPDTTSTTAMAPTWRMRSATRSPPFANRPAACAPYGELSGSCSANSGKPVMFEKSTLFAALEEPRTATNDSRKSNLLQSPLHEQRLHDRVASAEGAVHGGRIFRAAAREDHVAEALAVLAGHA